MEYRILGLSGLRVSAVGLGCMGMSHAYGAPADKGEMMKLLADAVEMGYDFFDTARSRSAACAPTASISTISTASTRRWSPRRRRARWPT